jgi:hypothetical protein
VPIQEIIKKDTAGKRQNPEVRYLAAVNEVIDKIRDGLVAYHEEQTIERGISLPFDPMAIVVKGSPWKPKSSSLVVAPRATEWVKENAWICFKPTVRSSANGILPPDGVILYEIHVLRHSSFPG